MTAQISVVDVMLVLTRGIGPGEVLLAQRDGTGFYDSWWNLPSGKLEDGEDIYEGLIREAREETGLALEVADLSVCGSVQFPSPKGTTRLGVFFHAEHDPDRHGEPVNAEPHKCAGIGWYRLDRLPEADLVPYNGAGIALHIQRCCPDGARRVRQ